MMRIGLDIDNTVLDYSDAFRASASNELGLLIPSTHGKILIKQQVIEVLGPSAWTKLQGQVYSQAPLGVKVSDGFEVFLERAKIVGAEITYVSHKTKTPIVGPEVNLRKPIKDFMLRKRLINPLDSRQSLHFCNSLSEKVEKIKSLDFDFFVDDLLEVVERLDVACRVVHFECSCEGTESEAHLGLSDWARIGDLCFG